VQSTLEDTPLTLTLSADDVDGRSLTFQIASGPSHGSLGAIGASSCTGTPSHCTATFTYVPAANYNGSDSFTFTASDGISDSAPATVSLTIAAVNDAPSFSLPASPDQSVVNDQGAQTVPGFASNISAGPPDESGQTLVFRVTADNAALFATQPAIDASSGDLTYAPSSSASGTTLVHVTLQDSGGTANGGVDTSAERTFTITVTRANHAPTAADQSVSTAEDTAKTITLTGGDPDGDSLSFSIVSGPQHGSLGAIGAVSCSGSPSACSAEVQYTPAANYNGPDSFTFKTNDGHLDSTTNGTISITVTPVNDAPVAADDSYPAREDATLPVSAAQGVLANDSDPDGDALQATVVSLPAHGLLTLNPIDGSFAYTPAPDFNGPDSFTYKASDGTATSNVATVTLAVAAVNDAPSFDLPASPSQSVFADAGAQTVPGFATNISAGPPDEAGQTLTFQVSNDDNSLFSVQPTIDATTGNLTYTPNPSATGLPKTATVTVVLKDNGGTANGGQDTSVPKTFTITIEPPNVAPVPDSQSTATDEDTPKVITLTSTDQDGTGPTPDALTFTVTSGPSHGTLNVSSGAMTHGSGVNYSAAVTYTPAANFHSPPDDSFSFTVSDDHGHTSAARPSRSRSTR
jgi:large repetitive protein